MKSKGLKLERMMLLTLMIAGLSAMYSCKTNKAENRQEEKKLEIQVKPPSMDIHAAAFMGKLDVVKQHIEAGTDLNQKDPMGGSTPLITATVFGRTSVAYALIDAGADLNVKNKDGSTALHSAAFFGRVEIVKALVKKGADKDIKNAFGSTAVETVAAPFKDVKMIYDQVSKDLGPYGLKLNYEHIQKVRPVIVEILK